MIDAVLERAIEDLTARDGGELERARALFYERTGEFASGDACFEERIRAFFDWFLVDHRDARGEPPAATWAKSAAEADVRVARALVRSERSLWAARADGLVEDLLGGARYRLEDARVREGDRFDGRLLVLDDVLAFAPGIVFHPPQTHEALDEMLAELGAPAELARADVLDGLLRMRMRLDRFTSIRPKHIYRVALLEEREILSAGWAKKDP